MSMGNWVADCGCLTLSFLAVGAGVPWRGLLLAYGAGQLASHPAHHARAAWAWSRAA